MTFEELRKKIGTQIEVAERLEISQQAIAKWEIGLSYPRRPTLKKLSEIFGVSEGEILASIDNSKREQ